VAVEHVLGRASRDEQVRLCRDVTHRAMSRIDISGTSSRAAGEQQQRHRLVGRPGEVAADQSADPRKVSPYSIARRSTSRICVTEIHARSSAGTAG
jgi:hypothetical protein